MRSIGSLICLFIFSLSGFAENWEYIISSPEYYYGEGGGATEKEAENVALSFLIGSISTNVKSNFDGLYENVVAGDDVRSTSRVEKCIKTYSELRLSNVQKLPTFKEGERFVSRCYIKRADVERIFAARTAKAKNMIEMAEGCLQTRNIDMALQYYYWAYALVRSLQFPEEAKDEEGNMLINSLPLKINAVLSSISVDFLRREGDYVDLRFKYNGEPVSSLIYSYNDGRSRCSGVLATDGYGSIQMIPDYETSVYHVDIEYQFKEQAFGDEVDGVLDVIATKPFALAQKKVPARKEMADEVKAEVNVAKPEHVSTNDVGNIELQEKVLGKVIDAINNNNRSDVISCFTPEGMSIFQRLIGYGKGRIVGEPVIKYHKGLDGRVVARGLQMSFSFAEGVSKKQFVENVSFTFNKDNKIENVAFGIGQVEEDAIFNRSAPGWKDDTREMLVEFLENYKTAYALERIKYIRQIFADDATIIVGNVAKKRTSNNSLRDEQVISDAGQETIVRNRYTKDTYLENLKKCFDRNEFINIRFSNNDIQWLDKYPDKQRFAIQLGQEYYSSTYADRGYLFLLVDLTNRDEPIIQVRTWQPNEVDMSKVYSAGDFFNE